MYQNCCKKCGSVSLHTEVKGNNTGLYCNDCGAWVKWLSKDELRAFQYSQKDRGLRSSMGTYDDVADDCKSELMEVIETLAYEVAKYEYPGQYDYSKEQIKEIMLCAGLDRKYLGE